MATADHGGEFTRFNYDLQSNDRIVTISIRTILAKILRPQTLRNKVIIIIFKFYIYNYNLTSFFVNHLQKHRALMLKSIFRLACPVYVIVNKQLQDDADSISQTMLKYTINKVGIVIFKITHLVDYIYAHIHINRNQSISHNVYQAYSLHENITVLFYKSSRISDDVRIDHYGWFDNIRYLSSSKLIFAGGTPRLHFETSDVHYLSH